jgi:hypothetical protein
VSKLSADYGLRGNTNSRKRQGRGYGGKRGCNAIIPLASTESAGRQMKRMEDKSDEKDFQAPLRIDAESCSWIDKQELMLFWTGMRLR